MRTTRAPFAIEFFEPSVGESSPMVLRVFCHSRPSRRILLLGGYDKGADASPRRQRREIELARRRLAEFLSRRANETSSEDGVDGI